jgi:hypothetical protein
MSAQSGLKSIDTVGPLGLRNQWGLGNRGTASPRHPLCRPIRALCHHAVGPVGPYAIMLSAQSGLGKTQCRPVGPKQPEGARQPGDCVTPASTLSAHSGLGKLGCRPIRA